MSQSRWQYVIETGALYLDGALLWLGYAGHGEGKNNPAMTAVHDVGPIPCGLYDIGAPCDRPGLTFALPLTPHISTETFGRGGFLIHGDNPKHPGEASHGCIIVPRWIREAIWSSKIRTLEVTTLEEPTLHAA